jgi:hypothetical protein
MTQMVRNVFVRDLMWGTNLLVSVSTNGLPADGISFDPVISGDGRFVAFTSSADNLVAGDTNRQVGSCMVSAPASLSSTGQQIQLPKLVLH